MDKYTYIVRYYDHNDLRESECKLNGYTISELADEILWLDKDNCELLSAIREDVLHSEVKNNEE